MALKDVTYRRSFCPDSRLTAWIGVPQKYPAFLITARNIRRNALLGIFSSVVPFSLVQLRSIGRSRTESLVGPKLVRENQSTRPKGGIGLFRL
jgi:hypothetical protein